MSWQTAHDLIYDEARWSDPVLEFGRWLRLATPSERQTDAPLRYPRGYFELAMLIALPLDHGHGLSLRQALILALVERGASLRSIAHGLDLSLQAVRTHYTRARSKLGKGIAA